MDKHLSQKLEPFIGKKVRIEFKDLCGCIGVLDHKGWKYGMNGCDWFCADSSQDHHIDCWFVFSKSNIKSIVAI